MKAQSLQVFSLHNKLARSKFGVIRSHSPVTVLTCSDHDALRSASIHLAVSVPVSQYTDDRHVGQLFRSPAESSLPPSRLLAEVAAYIMCSLLIEAAYFIGIGKSQWNSSTVRMCFVSLVYSAILCVRPSFCRMIRSSSLKL